MAAVIKVIHEDGRQATMTAARLTALAGSGWRAAEPTDLVSDEPRNIKAVLKEVGDDPVKAAAAIEIEKAGKNRPTLIEKLTAIQAAEATTPDQEN